LLAGVWGGAWGGFSSRCGHLTRKNKHKEKKRRDNGRNKPKIPSLELRSKKWRAGADSPIVGTQTVETSPHRGAKEKKKRQKPCYGDLENFRLCEGSRAKGTVHVSTQGRRGIEWPGSRGLPKEGTRRNGERLGPARNPKNGKRGGFC